MAATSSTSPTSTAQALVGPSTPLDTSSALYKQVSSAAIPVFTTSSSSSSSTSPTASPPDSPTHATTAITSAVVLNPAVVEGIRKMKEHIMTNGSLTIGMIFAKAALMKFYTLQEAKHFVKNSKTLRDAKTVEAFCKAMNEIPSGKKVERYLDKDYFEIPSDLYAEMKAKCLYNAVFNVLAAPCDGKVMIAASNYNEVKAQLDPNLDYNLSQLTDNERAVYNKVLDLLALAIIKADKCIEEILTLEPHTKQKFEALTKAELYKTHSSQLPTQSRETFLLEVLRESRLLKQYVSEFLEGADEDVPGCFNFEYLQSW